MTDYIPGPAGQLDALVEHRDPRRWCVLCHPHPQFGGSRFDQVLDLIAQGAASCDESTVRFNFRGVGGSDGAFDHGEGELDDLKAIVRWVLHTLNASDSNVNRTADSKPHLRLGGYSFGAHVTWRALTDAAFVSELTAACLLPAILVAPPVGRMAFPAGTPPCAVHAIAGDCDDFVDVTALAALSGVTSHIIAGADHFFAGSTTQLTTAIDSVMSPG